ncbi:MAG: LysM peptidoglycan-binding domain-containing protein [Cytophagales bacterium]
MAKLARICFFLLTSIVLANPCDSIGIEKKNGKTFVLHKVEQGQTLYSLSRKYNVKPDEISAENPETSNGIKIGMVLKIPRSNNSSIAEVKTSYPTQSQTKSESSPKTEATYHIVEKGQGLYSISKLYNVTVDQIKEWNNLPDNAVKLGMKLLVSDPDTKKEVVQHVHKVKTVEGQYYASSNNLIDTLTVKSFRKKEGPNTKITEFGVAETTDMGLNINQYEALHKTAPKGTFLTVLNLANNEKVFVRVVGKMPEEHDSKTVLMFSPKAQKRLYSSSSKTAVEVTYVVEEQ